MQKATFIIPKLGNDGQPFPAKVLAELQHDILDMFGGYTVRDVQGAWLGDDGKTYYDTSWEYTVVMEEVKIVDLINWLGKAKDLLSQQAMWLEVQDTTSHLI
jgi:hypothetical protein